MTTSQDLMAMLRASMHAPSRPSPGYVVGELEAPSGGRRADAIFLPFMHARRGEIHGYEFKISRSDLLTELSDPMKADPWMRYCTTWNLLVSDPKIVQGLDIPDAWGILAPPASPSRRALTVLRPAPKLTPVADVSPALMQIAARLYYADGVTERALQYKLESAERQAAGYSDMRQRAEDAERRLARLDPTQARDPGRDVVDAVVDALSHVWTDDYKTKIVDVWGASRIVELMTDIASLEALQLRLATTVDRDLRDLERVHEERGLRLKAARRQLTRKGEL